MAASSGAERNGTESTQKPAGEHTLVFSFKESAVGAVGDPALASHRITGCKLHLLRGGPHSSGPGRGPPRARSNFLVLQSAGRVRCRLLPCGLPPAAKGSFQPPAVATEHPLRAWRGRPCPWRSPCPSWAALWRPDTCRARAGNASVAA